MDAHASKRRRMLSSSSEISPGEQILQQEKAIMDSLSNQKALMSVRELAKGIQYSEPLWTGWRPPLHIRKRPRTKGDSIRKCWNVAVDGQDVPQLITKFKDMRFHDSILDKLKAKGVKRPSPIQAQGLSVALSGRDLIGISSTGSGKKLVFVLPLVFLALQEELIMPVVRGEGPFGLVICPSRELARQILEIVEEFVECLKQDGYPKLRTSLCIGGASMASQIEAVKKGVHIVVATPGRLKDLLAKKRINLDNCRYLTLDEADRLIDLGFEDDIRQVMNHFKGQRQTLLFSATMPAKIEDFARSSLVKPVTVTIGRAGAANLDVVQEVKYMKQEEKLVHLLKSLQETAPPVLVFSENKATVDSIYEYLLLSGVDAVAIHGGIHQEERVNAISSFKSGKKTVLVATDVASKGLDFPDIQHVINFDMPPEIENYVHRIGRTRRRGKRGLATTFINKKQKETILLDLKHLLQEAKQRIPPVLAELNDPTSNVDVPTHAGGGCGYCGGLGHRILNCPNLDQRKAATMASFKDYFCWINFQNVINRELSSPGELYSLSGELIFITI